MSSEPRILSIQSHVVSGYVGNRSAVFPLQLLGYEVDFINSVQLSNHTHYKHFKGQILSSDDIDVLYDSLKSNDIATYTNILTGYVGSSSFLLKQGEIISDLKSRFPKLKYYCDPVLGDAGKMYVPEELIPLYKEKILQLADAIFPNQFEAELLSDMKIIDEQSAIACIDMLHKTYDVPTVVISSTELKGTEGGDDRAPLIGYASHRHNDGTRQCIRLTMKQLPVRFVGTGDLFAALSLARMEANLEKQYEQSSKNDVKPDLMTIYTQVLGSMEAILLNTWQHAQKLDADPYCKLPSSARIELRLVQNQEAIKQPKMVTSQVEEIKSALTA